MSIFAPRYARAFAQVAASTHLDVKAAQAQLKDFAATVHGSRELREVLIDPSIPTEQKLKVVDAIASRLGMSQPVRNFVAVIIDHGRLPELDEILARYDAVVNAASGVAEAEIISARPLNEQDRAELEKQVAKLAGGDVRATYTQDPSLLGGAVVRIGSTVYDGSVKARLAELKQRLMNAQVA